MVAVETVVWYLIAFALLHAILFTYIYHKQRQATQSQSRSQSRSESSGHFEHFEGSEPAASSNEPVIDRNAGIVVCLACGTDNEVGYRFCHHCITKLPAATPFRKPTGTPGQRGIL